MGISVTRVDVGSEPYFMIYTSPADRLHISLQEARDLVAILQARIKRLERHEEDRPQADTE